MQTYSNIIYSATVTLEDGSRFEYNSDNLDCTFSIERSIVLAGSNAQIVIDNIKRDDFTRFYSPRILYGKTIRGVMEFSLGREGQELYQVFKKDIYEITTKQDGQTTQTTFFCMAGQFALSNVQTFSTQQATLKSILQVFAQNNNLEIGSLAFDDEMAVDFHLPASSGMQLLSTLRRLYPNINIYIDNNKLYAINFFDKVEPKNSNEGIVITPEQLISNPTSVEGTKIRIAIHLDPRVEVGQALSLTSNIVPQWNGSYSIATVKHIGNVSRIQSSNGRTEIDLLYLKARSENFV
jgi:hypothetical protein